MKQTTLAGDARSAPRPLFAQVLGDAFETLPAPLRALHSIRGDARYAGMATIRRGRHPLARLCGAVAGLPPASEAVTTTVDFSAGDRGEVWRRDFGGAGMRSRLWQRDGRLHERLGPLQFKFQLHARQAAIHWRVESVRLLGWLPLPVAWFGGVHCRERVDSGRYEFLVEARLPWIGPIVRYEGWLLPAALESAA